jgi:hypothetical protein
MSILSKMPDGFGFYYGLEPGDGFRQINVREENGERCGTNNSDLNVLRGDWVAYVGGEAVACAATKAEAEAKAIAWAKSHPEPVDDEDA